MRGHCLAAALCLGALLSAQDFILESLAFEPERFTIGQAVKATATLAPTGGGARPFSLSRGAGLPEPGGRDDPELLALSLEEGSGTWTLTARFIPWSPGPGRLALPSVSGLSLPAIPYRAVSVLQGGDRELAPLKPQLEPPGAWLYLYGFAGFFFVLAIAGAGIVLWALPGARRLLAEWRRAQAFKRLSEQLAFLETSLAEADSDAVEAFYAAFARSFRIYLAARVLPEAGALTPREIVSLPMDRFPAEGIREQIAALLAESDDVRFGGERPGRSSMARLLESARRVGKVVEEASP